MEIHSNYSRTSCILECRIKKGVEMVRTRTFQLKSKLVQKRGCHRINDRGTNVMELETNDRAGPRLTNDQN